MSENIEKWIGGVDEKLKNIAENVNKIEGHLEKINNRVDKVEDENIALDIKTKKNCESIKKLWERFDMSKLTMKDKIAIVVALLTGIFAIFVVVVEKIL